MTFVSLSTDEVSTDDEVSVVFDEAVVVSFSPRVPGVGALEKRLLIALEAASILIDCSGW